MRVQTIWDLNRVKRVTLLPENHAEQRVLTTIMENQVSWKDIVMVAQKEFPASERIAEVERNLDDGEETILEIHH